ncbi:TlpA disulfide reductase family protein [soil metagenome]
MRKALLVTAAIVVLAGCTTTKTNGQGFVTQDGSITTIREEGRKAAPVLEGKDLEGRPISSADFKGKVLVINVWGSWCNPCRAEAPALSAAAKELSGDGVQFMGIAIRDQTSSALAFERRNGITYPSIDDPSGKTLLGFASTGFPMIAPPTTYVFDANGKIAARVLGQVTKSTLVGLVEDVQKSTS